MPRTFAGAAAGCAATVPMTLAMLAGRRRLPPGQRYTLPPRRITDELADRATRSGAVPPASEPVRRAVSSVAHLGYGAATGALFAMIAAARPPARMVGSGAAWGLAVWMVSYLGWLPALRILPPPTREPAGRAAMMIGAHLVWGAVLGALLARRSPRAVGEDP
jgi:uncharacterized membrane protein YagU involved in acid resistance